MASGVDFSLLKLSDYVKTLANDDLPIYLDKLSVTDQKMLPDPYGLTKEQWINNAKLWPDIGYPDIYNYFVDGVNLYTKKEFKNYKSLEGYEYFFRKHVQPVFFHDPEIEDYVFLMADVLPSQRQGGKKDMYHAYLITRKDGCIHTAHCTCMAGCGKSCSHTAALAFKVEVALRTGLTKTASTSFLCQWNDMSRKKAEPCILSEINFRRSKYGQELDTFLEPIPRLPDADRKTKRQKVEIDFTKLKAIQPNAVVFSSLEVKTPPELPCTVFEGVSQLKNDINVENFSDLLSGLLSSETVTNLEKATIKQSKTAMWHNHRIGRITSSKMHRVFTLRESTSRSCVIKDVLEPHSVKTPAMTYGVQKEPIARAAYTKYSRMFHDGFVCTESGLVLGPDLPFLGASPDGLIECDCCGKGCLEIKCLKTYENGIPDPETVANIPNSFPISDELELKKSHHFYTQVQGHMLICKVGYCDFYLWSKSNSIAVRVFRDDDFIQRLVDKLYNEYKTHIFPAILEKVNIQV